MKKFWNLVKNFLRNLPVFEMFFRYESAANFESTELTQAEKGE